VLFFRKNGLIDVALVATAILTAIAFWTRNIIFIALLLPAGIMLVRHRADTSEEKDRREALATKTFMLSLLLPIVLIMGLAVYFLVKTVPLIILYWQ
jgi:heme/copper-type cytochrome/quinol oxidase subunit 2